MKTQRVLCCLAFAGLVTAGCQSAPEKTVPVKKPPSAAIAPLSPRILDTRSIQEQFDRHMLPRVARQSRKCIGKLPEALRQAKLAPDFFDVAGYNEIQEPLYWLMGNDQARHEKLDVIIQNQHINPIENYIAQVKAQGSTMQKEELPALEAKVLEFRSFIEHPDTYHILKTNDEKIIEWFNNAARSMENASFSWASYNSLRDLDKSWFNPMMNNCLEWFPIRLHREDRAPTDLHAKSGLQTLQNALYQRMLDVLRQDEQSVVSEINQLSSAQEVGNFWEKRIFLSDQSGRAFEASDVGRILTRRVDKVCPRASMPPNRSRFHCE